MTSPRPSRSRARRGAALVTTVALAAAVGPGCASSARTAGTVLTAGSAVLGAAMAIDGRDRATCTPRCVDVGTAGTEQTLGAALVIGAGLTLVMQLLLDHRLSGPARAGTRGDAPGASIEVHTLTVGGTRPWC